MVSRIANVVNIDENLIDSAHKNKTLLEKIWSKA